MDKATEKGIVVFNTPGANANAVKEAVLASILLQHVINIAANTWVNKLSGDDVPKQIEQVRSSLRVARLQVRHWVLLAWVPLVRVLLMMPIVWGMKVYGYDPYVSIEAAWNISRHV